MGKQRHSSSVELEICMAFNSAHTWLLLNVRGSWIAAQHLAEILQLDLEKSSSESFSATPGASAFFEEEEVGTMSGVQLRQKQEAGDSL